MIQNCFANPIDQFVDGYVSHKGLRINKSMLQYHGFIYLVLETNTGEITYGYKIFSAGMLFYRPKPFE